MESPVIQQKREGSLGILFAVVAVCALYTALTLVGSWDFLLDRPGVLRLSVAAPESQKLAVNCSKQEALFPDLQLAGSVDSTQCRSRFSFELPAVPARALSVYLPRAGKSARLSLNGVALHHSGGEEQRLFSDWSSPEVYPVPARAFRRGENLLLADVPVVAGRSGYVPTVYIGEESLFKTHLEISYASNRGLANVLAGVGVLAVFSFGVLSAAVGSLFYAMCAGVSLSLLASVVPHVVDLGPASMPSLLWLSVLSFLSLMAFMLGLLSQTFATDRAQFRFMGALIGLAAVGVVSVQWLLPGFRYHQEVMAVSSALVVVIGLWCALLLWRQFRLAGRRSTLLVFVSVSSMLMLGGRDLLVLWGLLSVHHGFFVLHAVAVFSLFLIVLIFLRIRQGRREQEQYVKALDAALQQSKLNINRSSRIATQQSLDALIGRIATTYSHEFRNPLAALLATSYSLQGMEWGEDARASLKRIDRSVNSISEVLTQQYDYYRESRLPRQESNEGDLPSWLLFVADYQSCKIIWLCDPKSLSPRQKNAARDWLEPFLRDFGESPSICMVQLRMNVTVLHLYMHFDACDFVGYEASSAESVPYHVKQEEKEAKPLGFLYWCHEFS